MTRSEKFAYAGAMIMGTASMIAWGFSHWRQGKLEARLRVIEYPLIEEDAPAKAPAPKLPQALPAKLPDAPEPVVTAKGKSPKPWEYTVGKRQSLKKPALLDGMTCWAQREAWNKAWLGHNQDLVARNRERHRRYPESKIDDFSVFPGDIIIRPTLKEVAAIKATVHCKKGDP